MASEGLSMTDIVDIAADSAEQDQIAHRLILLYTFHTIK